MNKFLDETVTRILNITKTPNIDHFDLILQEICAMVAAGSHDSALVEYALSVLEVSEE